MSLMVRCGTQKAPLVTAARPLRFRSTVGLTRESLLLRTGHIVVVELALPACDAGQRLSSERLSLKRGEMEADLKCYMFWNYGEQQS